MFFLVDAFTHRKFKGNPAGIVIVEDFPSKQSMQQMASFFKFPDLAFVRRINYTDFEIRWFSPMDESPICGHATLAASHIIFTQIAPEIQNINFLYHSGKLQVFKTNEDITIIFEKMHCEICTKIPFDVEKIIGIPHYESMYQDKYTYMIFLKDREDIFRLKPDFTAIKNLEKRSLIITSPGFGHYDFCVRYFVPKIGIEEDPVCGSANCKVSPIWSKRFNKKHMISYQASKREGIIEIRIDDDNNTISIQGHAITVCQFQDYNLIDI